MMHKTQEHNEPQWKAKVFPRYIQYWQPISQNRNLTILGPRIGVKKISYINVDTIILSPCPADAPPSPKSTLEPHTPR